MQFENKKARNKYSYGLSYNHKDNRATSIEEQTIYYLLQDVRQLNRIKRIMNTILANSCYADKERIAQINRASQTGILSKEELNVLNKAWDLRKKIAHKLIHGLTFYLEQYDTKIDPTIAVTK